MDTTTYKLARAIGGCCHFAETTVSVVRNVSTSAAVIAPHLDDLELAWALPHALTGAQQALVESGLAGTSVEITGLRVTECDSNPHIVAVSAYIAATQALSADRLLRPFVVDGRLNFPSIELR